MEKPIKKKKIRKFARKFYIKKNVKFVSVSIKMLFFFLFLLFFCYLSFTCCLTLSYDIISKFFQNIFKKLKNRNQWKYQKEFKKCIYVVIYIFSFFLQTFFLVFFLICEKVALLWHHLMKHSLSHICKTVQMIKAKKFAFFFNAFSLQIVLILTRKPRQKIILSLNFFITFSKIVKK